MIIVTLCGVALFTTQAGGPYRPDLPAHLARVLCHRAAPHSDGSGRFRRVSGWPGIEAIKKDELAEAYVDNGHRRRGERGSAPGRTGDAMPGTEAGAAAMRDFGVIATRPIVSRDTGYRVGQAMLGMSMDTMRICHRDTREPERQQDSRHQKPAQKAQAFCS